MMNLSEQDELRLTLRVPRSAFVIVAPKPATVTQRTVEQHFGIPPRMYRAMVRDGFFPAKRIGRLIFATYEDVHRAVTEGAVARTRVEDALKAAIAEPAKDAPMSVDAAHAYLASARTPHEKREREKEIEAMAQELMSGYGTELDDGSPNTNHNKALYDQGMGLFLATVGLRLKGSPEAASTADPMPGQGCYRKCCWCERPAYATKQTWMGSYWSGGPVCEVCARRRAPNERVVQTESQKILLPARDPTVPRAGQQVGRSQAGAG